MEMLYAVNEKTEQIDFAQIKAENKTIGLITVEELKENNHIFQFSADTISKCESEKHGLRSMIDVYNEYSFVILDIINVKDILGKRDRIGIFIQKNLFLIVDIKDDDGSTEKLFNSVIENSSDTFSMEKAVYNFIDGLIYDDYETIEQMGYTITSLEELVINNKAGNDFNKIIFPLKKQLLILHNFYEQLMGVGDELRQNSNDLFEENNLRLFKLFTDKVNRLDANVNLLRDGIVQLREAYESAVNLEINKVMKIFTVVTIVFLPLTLIAGWYGMNFRNMPELSWTFGYPTVVALSILIVVAGVIYFKKKKFF